MGLGPKGVSLMERLGKAFEPTVDFVAMEQGQRTFLRRQAQIAHAKATSKPQAPVEPLPKEKGVERRWKWVGESIESKGLIKDGTYVADFIREQGFKLPTIGGKKNEKQDSGCVVEVVEIVDEGTMGEGCEWSEGEGD